MQLLGWISILPVFTALLTIVISDMKIIRKIVPLIIWTQFILIACQCAGFMGGTIAALSSTSSFSMDHISGLFLTLTTFVVACSLTHAKTFFEKEETLSSKHKPIHERIFYASSAFFLLAMSFVFICDNLGFLWISIEATTLSSAALVYFAGTKRSIEATWKYLIICSVGIAFALFGTVLIFASSQYGAISSGSLNLRLLLTHASSLQYPLLRLGYIFCLLGYGTKAGVFPLHSWLPDAHSEAPAPASAMLSGSLLNCALFIIWRLSQLVAAAHHGTLAYTLPLTLGTVTVVAASFFLVHQHSIKRLWAYSSIENVGIMLVAIALGSAPLFFLQALNHSIAKVALFLLSGNFIQATGAKYLSEIRGILNIAPLWGVLFALSAFAVTGAPPFGAFISEWLILANSADHGQWLVVAALLFALALSFVAVSIHMARVIFGTPMKTTTPFKLRASSLIPGLLVLCTLVTGLTGLPAYLVCLK